MVAWFCQMSVLRNWSGIVVALKTSMGMPHLSGTRHFQVALPVKLNLYSLSVENLRHSAGRLLEAVQSGWAVRTENAEATDIVAAEEVCCVINFKF